METWTRTGATPAGTYNALVNGKDNYAADRAAAAAAIRITPQVREAALNGRAFLDRAVRWAAGQGIGQFLDLGCGYPVEPVTHESAGDGARVCYVDNDPVVACHARALLARPGITAHEADLRDADRILRECEDDGWDLSEPSCVILGLVVQYMDGAQAREVTGRYISRLAPGSAVIISAWAVDEDDLADRLTATHPAELHRHSRDDLRAMLGGLELVPPGITRARWWPAVGAREPVASRAVHVLAAVAVKPR